MSTHIRLFMIFQIRLQSSNTTLSPEDSLSIHPSEHLGNCKSQNTAAADQSRIEGLYWSMIGSTIYSQIGAAVLASFASITRRWGVLLLTNVM